MKYLEIKTIHFFDLINLHLNKTIIFTAIII